MLTLTCPHLTMSLHPHVPHCHAPHPLHKPCHWAFVTACTMSLCPLQLHAPPCLPLTAACIVSLYLLQLHCNGSAPSSWFSTLSPPSFSFAPNVTPDNFKSPGLAPPPCLPSCPVTCMPHVTCPEDPEA
jgi:hypothetical protein